MNYWIIIDETEQGPLTIEELRGMAIGPDTPVWCEGMADWMPASQIPELAGLIVAPVVETPPVPADAAVQVPPVPATAVSPLPQVPAQPCPAAPQPEIVYVPADAIPAGYVAVMPAGGKCSTYLFWAIFSTIVFFLPLGICAIICSVKTRSHLRAGRIEKAARMSERTALFVILSLVSWLIWMPFSVVFSMI